MTSFHRQLDMSVRAGYAGLLLAPLLVLAFAGGCDMKGNAAVGGAGESSAGDEIPRVQIVKVTAQDLEQKIQLPGTVEGFATADLYAKVGGYLEEIKVDIGDRVQKNQVLARLSIPEMVKELRQKQASIATAESDVHQAKAAIRQAEAQVARAVAKVEETKAEQQEKQPQLDFRDAEYNRIKGLVERRSVSRELLDEVTLKRGEAQAALNSVKARIHSANADLAATKADVQKAESDYARAQAYVDLAKADHERVQALAEYAVIKAPFSGVITKRMVDAGAFIQPADGNSAAKPLLTVTQTDRVRIWLHLPMGKVRWLNKGDRAVLDRINVLPGKTFDGSVTRFAPGLDPSSRMMRVEIDLKNPQHQLMPGYYGYVALHLDLFKQVPVVPSSAILADGNDTVVFVVEDNICKKTVITTNYQDGTIVGVESGLTAGQQVIQAGAGQLVDGQRVLAVE